MLQEHDFLRFVAFWDTLANLKDENLLTAFQYISIEEGLNIFLEHAKSLNINIRNHDGDTTLERFTRGKNIRVGKIIVYYACFRN